MNKVYLLEFTGTDDQHVIGVFSSAENAQQFANDCKYQSWELFINEWVVDTGYDCGSSSVRTLRD